MEKSPRAANWLLVAPALLIDAALIIKGSVSLRQWRVLASIILAAADVLLPLVFLAIVGIVIRGLLKML